MSTFLFWTWSLSYLMEYKVSVLDIYLFYEIVKILCLVFYLLFLYVFIYSCFFSLLLCIHFKRPVEGDLNVFERSFDLCINLFLIFEQIISMKAFITTWSWSFSCLWRALLPLIRLYSTRFRSSNSPSPMPSVLCLLLLFLLLLLLLLLTFFLLFIPSFSLSSPFHTFYFSTF